MVAVQRAAGLASGRVTSAATGVAGACQAAASACSAAAVASVLPQPWPVPMSTSAVRTTAPRGSFGAAEAAACATCARLRASDGRMQAVAAWSVRPA